MYVYMGKLIEHLYVGERVNVQEDRKCVWESQLLKTLVAFI